MCKFNYEQQDFKVLLIKPAIDTRDITPDGKVVTRSRIGLESECYTVDKEENLYKFVFNKNQFKDNCVVIVDECQFLTKDQVNELKEVSRKIPVICYGLRTDFQTRGFPGSTRLLELAHTIEEMKTICTCGRKAMYNARFVNGKFTVEGDQVAIDGENSVTYEPLCPHCYYEKINK